jgi:ABC-2 type transport system permease protein
MRFWAIGKRNLKVLYRDPVALGFLLGMPLAFILIFSFAFGGQATNPISIGVVDEDQSQISDAFVSSLESISTLEIVSPIYSTQSEAEKELRVGGLSVYLLLPNGFGEAVTNHQLINLTMAYNETDPILVQRTMPIIREVALGFLDISIPFNIELSQKEVEIKDEYINNLVPGMAVFGIMILITSVGGIMVRDRTRGFLSRLMTTPAKPSDFIFGYTLHFIPVIIASIAIYLGVGILMGLSIVGNFGLAFLILFILGLCCMGIGMIVGTLAKSEDQASGAPFLFIVPIVMISGAWWSVEQMPAVVKSIAEALPFLHAIDATRDVITRGFGFTDVLPDIYWLIGWAIVLFTIGIILFRRSMAR